MRATLVDFDRRCRGNHIETRDLTAVNAQPGQFGGLGASGIAAPPAMLQLSETRHILIANGIYEG
jgi:hypothetical protein